MSDRDGQERPSGDGPRPEILAHRGFAPEGAENTLEAFRAAAELGVRWIETDVNTTADGVPVLIHDPSLERVTGVPDDVAAVTAERLEEVRLPGGEHVPTLARALAEFPELRFNIDIKDEGAVARIPGVVRAAGAEGRIRLASFSESRRRRVQRALEADGVRVLASPGYGGIFAFWLVTQLTGARGAAVVWPRVARLLRRWIAPFDALQVPASHRLGPITVHMATPRLVAAAHACGYRVEFWTVNSREEMRRLAALGADGLITDRCDLAVAEFPPAPDADTDADAERPGR
ncbi:esterase [Rothia sp. AR01]|uniref:Esterase n=1 Tax=Rothia santali TaxID=2949643 RepID=A0A9X2KIB8_9MICC|nr:glycerophosphodiester phosphodiesterase family protein [Rothia santali]MCP3425694.1 esterase [Rothia santali]